MPALLLLMPVHAASLACEAIFLTLTGTGRQKAVGIYGGIAGELWRNRRHICNLVQTLTYGNGWPAIPSYSRLRAGSLTS